MGSSPHMARTAIQGNIAVLCNLIGRIRGPQGTLDPVQVREVHLILVGGEERIRAPDVPGVVEVLDVARVGGEAAGLDLLRDLGIIRGKRLRLEELLGRGATAWCQRASSVSGASSSCRPPMPAERALHWSP